MKKLSIFLIIILFHVYCYSQDTIELKLDTVKKDFVKKAESVKFKSGETYIIKIEGLNTSILDYKINSKSYTLISATPDILNPIIPGIPANAAAAPIRNRPYTPSQTTDVYSAAINRYNKLCQLKSISDSLYIKTMNKRKIDTIGVNSVLKEVQEIFEAESLNDLKQQVNLYLKYITTSAELFKQKIEENPASATVNEYNFLLCVLDSIKTINYFNYINFIEKSLTAKDYIVYKPFKAEKDIVDLNLTIINNYVKDTIYNSSISFYTSGKLGLDFSTGFFYNNLHEKSYYTEKRDALKNNVLVENNSAFDVSIGALAHLSYKITNCFQAGVSMGAALSPLDSKTRYLIGGSLIIGRKNQLGINGGLAFAKINVLSSSVKNDETGYYTPIDITTVPTYGKILSGFYLGITYNLTSTKK